MADIREVIRRLIYRYETVGAEQLADANRKVEASTQSVDKASLSLEKTFASLERRYNTTLRAQQDYEATVRKVNAAVAQNPALQERANAMLAMAAKYHEQQSRAAQAGAVAMADFNARVAAAAGSAGTLGQVLSSLGRGGVVAAAGIGLAVLAIKAMSDASHDLAEKSIELRRFADVTGLTTIQIQALRSEAAKFGLTGDDIQSSIQQFTARFNELRIGQGELLTQVRRLDPALAVQMQSMTNAGDALTLFGQALLKVDNIFERNALVKAATGRGGLINAGFLTGLNVDAVTKSFVDAGKGIDDNLIRKIAQLEVDIHKLSGKAKQDMASIWAVPILEMERDIAAWFAKLGEKMKQFKARADRGEFTGGGAASFDEAGFVVPSNVPLPRPAPGQRTPQAIAKELQEQIAAMGEAATAADKLRLAQMQLAIAGKDAGLSQEQLARAAAALKEQFASQGLNARIGQLGELVTVEELVRQKQFAINEANKQGAGIYGQLAASILDVTQKSAELNKERGRVTALGEAATETEKYELKIRELNLELQKGVINQNDFNRAVIAAHPAFGQMKSGIESAFTSLATGIATGVDGMTLLVNLTKQLGASMTQVGTKSLTDSLVKGLSGGGFGVDPVSMGVGLAGMAMSMISSWLGAKKAEEEAAAKARQAWLDLADEVEDFMAKAFGTGISSVAEEIAAFYEEYRKLADAALAAKDLAAIAELQDAFNAFAAMQVADFAASLGDLYVALNAGLGPDSPVIKATDNINKLADEMKDLVASVEFINESGGSTDVAAATAAAVSFLVQQIGELEPLSDVAQALMTINAEAEAVTAAVIELGDASAETAAAIQAQTVKALDDLTKSFTDSLQADINTANGQSYLNDVADLLDQWNQMWADAAALGLDPNITTDWFTAMAQDIVDGADLTQEAFDELIAAFPALYQYVNLTADTIVRSADEIADAAQSIQDRIFALGVDTSTYEGALAALQYKQQQETLAEEKAGGELLVDLQRLHYLELLDLQKEFADKALEETKRAAEAELAAREQGARKIADFLIDLQRGTDSPLAPSQRLSTAQQAFNATDALARGGNLDALARWTQEADALIKAARNYFGSGTGFQAIYQDVINKGTSMPAVQTSSDPVVQQLIGVVAAVNAVTQAVGGTTTAVGGVTTAVGGTTSAVNTGTSGTTGAVGGVDASVDALVTPLNTMTNSLGTLNATVSALNATMAGVTAAVNAGFSGSGRNKFEAVSDAIAAAIAAMQTKLTDSNSWDSYIYYLEKQYLDWIYWNVRATANNTRYGSAFQSTAQGIVFALNSSSIPAYAQGGWVNGPGGPRDDMVPAWLSNREFVVSAAPAQRHASLLEDINSGRYRAPTLAYPANDNGWRHIGIRLDAMHSTMGSLLSRVVHLEERNVAATERSTEALMLSAQEARRKARIESRKKAA